MNTFPFLKVSYLDSEQMAFVVVLGIFTKLQRVTIIFAMPFCLHVSSQLPLGGFLLSLRSETFMTLSRKCKFVKIEQKY